MKTSQCFLFYPTDFLCGTASMTPAQVGVFIRLLAYQWQDGPLENDKGKLMRMTLCENDSDLAEVLKKFQDNRQGKLVNRRLEQVRKERENFVKSRRDNGSKGGRPKNLVVSTSLPSAKLMKSSPIPSPIPSPRNILSADGEGENEDENAFALEPVTTDKAPARKPHAKPEHSPAFQEFWRVYPRKESKADAVKAWTQVKGEALATTIMAGLAGFAFSEEVQFIPLPATWLRKRRWEDEPLQAATSAAASTPPAVPILEATEPTEDWRAVHLELYEDSTASHAREQWPWHQLTPHVQRQILEELKRRKG